VRDRVRLNVAYLDLDLGRKMIHLHPIWIVLRAAGLRPRAIATIRTRRGWHIKIHLTRRLAPAELVALQACCGSDRRRETLNLMRILAIARHDPGPFWRARWNLLYSRKLT